MNKLALYFHLPFCLKKCLYCDFCSRPSDESVMHAYRDALIREMRARAPLTQGYTVDTVFFGGGTPSLYPFEDLAAVLYEMHRLFTVEADAEITLEANPATIDEEKLRALRRLGFNRLSIGMQSASEKELAALGRAHTARDAKEVFLAARRAGLENINVDVMYGIPYQTEGSFGQTLDTVLSLSPEHISAYSLIIEEGTPFYAMQNELPLPDEDTEDALHRMLLGRLCEAGYLHYEISNFAKEGCECRHNLHYWRAEEYLGFGAAAYSFFGGERYGNGRDTAAYIESPTENIFEREVINPRMAAYEYIMLRFRLKEGLDLDAYEKRFGERFEQRYRSEIEGFLSSHLMQRSGKRLFLTEKGMRLSNSVLVAFLKDED